MQDETFFDSMKRNLNGEPGQPIVLGVCKTLAARLFAGQGREGLREQYAWYYDVFYPGA